MRAGRDRDVAAVVLLPAGAGGGHSAARLSPAETFLLIVVIMSFIRWAGFARIIRGMVASLRELEYVQAARALWARRAGASSSATSFPAPSATPSSPRRSASRRFILGESALSLLGLGIQEPSASWGNLLADAQNVQNLVKYPWILTPGVFIFLTVMASTSSATTCATASIRGAGCGKPDGRCLERPHDLRRLSIPDAPSGRRVARSTASRCAASTTRSHARAGRRVRLRQEHDRAWRSCAWSPPPGEIVAGTHPFRRARSSRAERGARCGPRAATRSP